MSNERGPKSKRREPTLLADVLAQTEATSARAAGSAIAPALWRHVVGERVALRSRPGKLERGTLTVNVASSVWAQELSLLSTELLLRLQAQGVAATGLRFRVENFTEAEATASQRTPATTSESLPLALRQRLEEIDDAELRSAVAEAAALLFPAAKK